LNEFYEKKGYIPEPPNPPPRPPALKVCAPAFAAEIDLTRMNYQRHFSNVFVLKLDKFQSNFLLLWFWQNHILNIFFISTRFLPDPPNPPPGPPALKVCDPALAAKFISRCLSYEP
jgi:hypothetical protein